MKSNIYIQLLLVFFFLPAFSQNDTIEIQYSISDKAPEEFGLFTNDEVLKISLQFDIREYTRKRSKDEYMNAILTYYINDKDFITKEIRLKTRGEFRHGYCSFPPIKLNFRLVEVGLVFRTFSIAAMISPFFVGLIADKFFASEKVLGFLHIPGGVRLFATT